MPLSDDQRAMLQLMLQRGQSYEDIGSLLGLEVEEVRSRAREALREIGGDDPDRDVSLTDYLLGQADPIGRADAARQLQADAETRELAESLVTQLRVLAPGAELPEIPAAGAGPKPRAAAAKPAKAAAGAEKAPTPAAPSGPPADATPARRPLSSVASDLSRRQRQIIAGLVGGGIVILLIVLGVAGVFGGGNNDDGETGSSIQAQDRNQPGVAAFPIVRQKVGRNGQLRGAIPIPPQILQALQQGIFSSIDISRAEDSEVTRALREARQSQRLPAYAGDSVVRGPIVGPGFGGGGSSNSGLTRAVLRPRNGSNAEGVAVFARVRNTPVLQVNVANLPPSRQGEAYVIWFYG